MGSPEILARPRWSFPRPWSPVGETTLSAQNPMTEARLVVDSSSAGRVGVAVSNPGLNPLEVDWELLDDSGRAVASGVLGLAERGQSAQFVDELAGGLEQPFLGVLRLHAERPFLVAGLRLSGLQLSTIPVAPGAGPARSYGFERLAEDPPQPPPDNPSRQVLLGPGDEQALVTLDGQVLLLSREGVRVLFGPGRPLPEADYSGNPPADVFLVEFGPAGLLFSVSPANGRPGLFLWDGSEVRRLVRSGQALPGGVDFALRVEESVQPKNSAPLLLSVSAEDSGLVATPPESGFGIGIRIRKKTGFPRPSPAENRADRDRIPILPGIFF